MMGKKGGAVQSFQLPCRRERQDLLPLRTRSTHRPREDIVPPRQNSTILSAMTCRQAPWTTAVEPFLQRKSVPSTHMRCRITASRLATATMARPIPRR